jgi:integrase
MSNYKTSITKDENGYRVHYSYISCKDGKRHRTCKRGFKRQKDATLWMQKELPQLIRQLEQESPLDENLTMGELIEEYLQKVLLRRRETTYENKSNIINNKILPHFANHKVFQVTPKQIEDWQDWLLSSTTKNGTPYSPTYIRSIRSQLTAIFNYAVRLHNLPENPMNKAEIIGSKKAKERSYWKVEEYLKFRTALEDTPMYYYAFEVLFWTGLRMGEMFALTLGDIDFTNKTLRVDESYQRLKKKDLITDPKNESSKRTIVIPDMLVAELKEYVDSLYGANEQSRLFTFSRTSLHRVLEDGCRISGVKKIAIHDIRHSHISMLANSGIPSVIIAPRVGHALQGMTGHYSHPYASADIATADMLNRNMESQTNVREKI